VVDQKEAFNWAFISTSSYEFMATCSICYAVTAAIRCSAMLRRTIYSMPIIILTIGAASAQTDMQELRDIKSGQTSFRTQQEKKNDRDIDRAYQSSFKRIPDAKQKNSDPWGDARSAPPAAGKNKQSRIVSGEKTVSCNADEVLVTVICSEGAPDGAGCSTGSPTGLCMHK
jgi:hypothetical protein